MAEWSATLIVHRTMSKRMTRKRYPHMYSLTYVGEDGGGKGGGAPGGGGEADGAGPLLGREEDAGGGGGGHEGAAESLEGAENDAMWLRSNWTYK